MTWKLHNPFHFLTFVSISTDFFARSIYIKTYSTTSTFYFVWWESIQFFSMEIYSDVLLITIQEFSLPFKIIFWWFKSVENEQDFEFLAGMLLLRTVNGSSSFSKGPRKGKVWKSVDPSGPWTFKLSLSLDLCKNYYSHELFAVMYHSCKIDVDSNARQPNEISERIF